MKKSILWFLCLNLVLILDAQEARTENNGNLILEDIPIIPQSIKDDLSKFQNVRSAGFRGFNHDNGILITTRFGNVSQLHSVESPGATRQQVTFFQEPIGSISTNPNDSSIAFTMDKGGTENAQIYLLDTDNGESKLLTDGSSRNGGPLWSNGGDMIAFQSTRRNGRSNDIWLMSVENPDKAKILLKSSDGSWWGASGWAKDDSKVLVQNYISVANSKAYIIDLKSKQKKLVLGNENESSVNAALAFDKNDQGLFFITDRFAEYNQLAYKNLNTEEIIVISKDISWDVDGFAINEKGDRAAFVVNENGYSSLYLLNPQTFKYKKVKSIPIGLIGGMEFNRNNKSLGLTINTFQSPSDAHVLDLKSNALGYGSLTRWTFSEVVLPRRPAPDSGFLP